MELVSNSRIEALDKSMMVHQEDNTELDLLIRTLSKPQNKRTHDDLYRLTKIIQKIKYFEKLELKYSDYRDICQCLKYRSMHKGGWITEYGTIGTKFYVILSGETCVYIPGSARPRGGHDESSCPYYLPERWLSLPQQMIHVKEYYSGASFGELALIHEEPRAATIVCKTDCHFAYLEKDEYQLILEQIHEKSLAEILNFFQGLPYFKHWSRKGLAKLQLMFDHKEITRNQILFKCGDPANEIYIIKEGDFDLWVKVAKEPEAIERNINNFIGPRQMNKDILKEGGSPLSKKFNKFEDIKLMQLGKGKLAGVEDALIEDGRYAYTLICKSASAYLLSIPVHKFLNRLQQDEETWNFIRRYIVRSNMELSRRMYAFERVKEQRIKSPKVAKRPKLISTSPKNEKSPKQLSEPGNLIEEKQQKGMSIITSFEEGKSPRLSTYPSRRISEGSAPGLQLQNMNLKGEKGSFGTFIPDKEILGNYEQLNLEKKDFESPTKNSRGKGKFRNICRLNLHSGRSALSTPEYSTCTTKQHFPSYKINEGLENNLDSVGNIITLNPSLNVNLNANVNQNININSHMDNHNQNTLNSFPLRPNSVANLRYITPVSPTWTGNEGKLKERKKRKLEEQQRARSVKMKSLSKTRHLMQLSSTKDHDQLKFISNREEKGKYIYKSTKVRSQREKKAGSNYKYKKWGRSSNPELIIDKHLNEGRPSLRGPSPREKVQDLRISWINHNSNISPQRVTYMPQVSQRILNSPKQMNVEMVQRYCAHMNTNKFFQRANKPTHYYMPLASTLKSIH